MGCRGHYCINSCHIYGNKMDEKIVLPLTEMLVLPTNYSAFYYDCCDSEVCASL